MIEVTAKSKFKQLVKTNYVGWLFNLPLMIGLLVFTAIPVVTSLVFSFQETDGLSYTFLGLKNYIKAFTAGGDLGLVVKNTIVYTVMSIPINLVLSYLLAVLVNRSMKGVKGFRVLYYLPCIIPAVVSGLLWKDIYDPTYGIFNKILSFVGLGPFPFFSSPKTSMFSVILMNLWTVGSGMILWLAAFKNIPKELYECADLEGAGAFRRLVSITIPMSTPMIFFNVVTSVIGTLQYNGTLTFAPSDGMGQDKSLYMYAVKIYRIAIRADNVGYGSALAWLLLIVVGIITFILFKTSKWVFYGEDA